MELCWGHIRYYYTLLALVPVRDPVPVTVDRALAVWERDELLHLTAALLFWSRADSKPNISTLGLILPAHKHTHRHAVIQSVSLR